MRDAEQKAAAKKFVENWTNKGYEKGDSQSFWQELLRDVLGVAQPSQFIEFEKQVSLGHTSFVDGYIPSTNVIIEQKGRGKDLRKAIKQSDGTSLTPYQQAQRYTLGMKHYEHPRWIITCNFEEFLVYDMNDLKSEPESILLKDLAKDYYRLGFIVDSNNDRIIKEMQVSIKAGELVGILYDRILQQYIDPANPHSLHSLNILCVRLVFCLYAEDAGLFGLRSCFNQYIKAYPANGMRDAIIKLFAVLDTKPEDRDSYLDDQLAAFPYVNGGLFEDKSIEIPQFNAEIRELLLRNASDDFDWSEISPTIFGAVFESTLNPETRRSGGMHYTSIENIHKVIDPLFLDELREELRDIKALKVTKTRERRLLEFKRKLASLVFLDPACGSGNFLTETYISLRRLENEAIKEMAQGQLTLDFDFVIMISIGQFYGIEINDFAVAVAKTALWIAESQMMKATEAILNRDLDFLPLKSNDNIVEGNALRLDWNDVVPKEKLSYIMGNPPFVGLSLRSKEQQIDMECTFKDNPRGGRLDYVAAWYIMAASYAKYTNIQCAFVSTNSIVQGEQVPILWEDMLIKHNMNINFAYRPFVWSSETKDKAAVHCVIIGFGYSDLSRKMLFESDGQVKHVDVINGYLVNAACVFINLRGNPREGYPKLIQGNKPWDGGNLILSSEERENIVSKHPKADHLIKKYIGSYEFINNKTRYCLWLKDVSPNEYRDIPEILQRLSAVAEVRKNTRTVAVQAQAATPMLFSQIRQPKTDYILIPETSSSNRKYIPIGFFSKDIIASNSTLIATNASFFHFGILTSNVHMAWMRTVCGRLKSDYRYSPSVYNNFPWPSPTDEQRAAIEQTAQEILDARALYPESSLADMYGDKSYIYTELQKAHQRNDRAVMKAYGFDVKRMDNESYIVAALMKMYQKLTEGLE